MRCASFFRHKLKYWSKLFSPSGWPLWPRGWVLHAFGSLGKLETCALLIGDAAHATTAHTHMGGGMVLEGAVVLGQCVVGVSTLLEALETFMIRRFERVRRVVETSVRLSHLDQEKAPSSERPR